MLSLNFAANSHLDNGNFDIPSPSSQSTGAHMELDQYFESLQNLDVNKFFGNPPPV
jgi:hypothetical protein